MEKFFDLASFEEITSHFSGDETPLSAEEIASERRTLEKDTDMNLEYLVYLFAGRGDFARADKYVEAIQDDMRRADTARMLTHINGYLDYAANDAEKLI
jgi:hypothetical protein